MHHSLKYVFPPLALIAVLSGCPRSEPPPSGPPQNPGPGELVVGDDPCQSDADCVHASCCHPSACVAQEHAPVCNMLCTQICTPLTTDCGGGCLCHHGKCAARLNTLSPNQPAP
jgi:hypothetical protein